jgi:hypothetical protein
MYGFEALSGPLNVKKTVGVARVQTARRLLRLMLEAFLEYAVFAVYRPPISPALDYG